MREEYTFFEEPKQVEFIDVHYDDGSENPTPRWLGGIVYQDEIICGCCGGIISLEELYADWRDFAYKNYPDIENPLEVYEYWVDISNEIKGDY